MTGLFTEENAQKAQAEMERFWHDLDEESDRGMVLSAVAYFEKLLGDCLASYLKDIGPTRELRSSSRELGTFSARNKFCLALRIITDQEYQTLKIMASIRNDFAHKVLTHFADPSVSDKTLEMARILLEDNQLVWAKLKTDSPRKKFSFATFCLNDLLWLRPYDVSLHVENYPNLVPEHTYELTKTEAE